MALRTQEQVIAALVAKTNEQSVQIAALQGLVAVLASSLDPIQEQIGRSLATREFKASEIRSDMIRVYASYGSGQMVDKIAAAGRAAIAAETAKDEPAP